MTATEFDRCQMAYGHALQNEGLQVLYQPIVTAHEERVGFEALSRFSNRCPPDAVWAWAHQCGDVARLDRMALRNAVVGARSLPGLLFLNLGILDEETTHFLSQLGGPERVVWEVTETAHLTTEGVRAAAWVKQQGYALAMDDAGAGNSTVERLHALRADIVKLDREVVGQWAQGNVTALREWTAIASQWGVRVLAEGIEERDWVAPLVREGVQWFQGYALGRPAPASAWRDNYQNLHGEGIHLMAKYGQ